MSDGLRRIGAGVVVAIALGVLAALPDAQGPVLVSPALQARVADGRHVRVMVGVNQDVQPEGHLTTAADVDAQRTAIRLALDEATQRAAAAGVEIDHRFEFMPFFSARVNATTLAALASTPGIVSIVEDALFTPALGDTVPLIGAEAAQMCTTGQDWHVAVLDSGVDAAHPMIAGKVASEACYSWNDASIGASSLCPGQAIESTLPGSASACSGVGHCSHGTHVAGIAVGNENGVLHGVAKGADLIAIQVFTRFDNPTECTPGASPCLKAYYVDIAKGLERVRALAALVPRIAAVNLSVAGSPYTAACDDDSGHFGLRPAIAHLRSLGIATVVSSGNKGLTNAVSSPACMSTTVSVGATTKSDAVWMDSATVGTNRRPGMVSLMAPGALINASVPGGGYGVMSGTSMAAPHVAGAWALLKKVAPQASVFEILTALQATGVDINDPPSGGLYQRINVELARRFLVGSSECIEQPVPGPPGTPTATVVNSQVSLQTTPSTTGGAASAYELVARATATSAVLATIPLDASLTLTANAPNGSYYVTARARNSVGVSAESAGVSFTVPQLPPPPGIPANVTATVNGNTVTITWTAPATGGAVASYVLIASLTPGGPAVATVPLTGTSFSVSGVAPGTYYVRVVALNAAGMSTASAEVMVVVLGPAPPLAPTMNAPAVNGSTVGLSWLPATTGPAPTHYLLSAFAGGAMVASVPTPDTGLVATSVPNGTYVVSVRAANAAGVSAPSNSQTIVVGGSGGPPLQFTVPSSPLVAIVNEPFRYSFCHPDPAGGLCAGGGSGDDVTPLVPLAGGNPTGGAPPYHFQLATGVGFPPINVFLNLNGVLAGTPSVPGDYTFGVCAVDLVGAQVCPTVVMRVLAQRTAELLATGQESPGSVVVDSARVYWLDIENGRVGSTTLAPGGVVQLHSAPLQGGAQLAQDASSLYFVQSAATGTIYRASKAAVNGEDRVSLAVTGAGRGIALGPTGGTLYFKGPKVRIPAGQNAVPCQIVNDNPPEKLCDTVARMPITGGTQTRVVHLAQGQSADTISTDSTSVYWTDTGLAQNSGAIRHAPLGGGDAVTDVANLNSPFSLVTPSTGAEAGSLFWMELTPSFQTVLKRRTAAGAVSTIMTNGPEACVFHCVAVSDGFVYTEQDGNIVRLSIDGGPVTVLAPSDTGLGWLSGIAVDATHVYWANDYGRVFRILR